VRLLHHEQCDSFACASGEALRPCRRKAAIRRAVLAGLELAAELVESGTAEWRLGCVNEWRLEPVVRDEIANTIRVLINGNEP